MYKPIKSNILSFSDVVKYSSIGFADEVHVKVSFNYSCFIYFVSKVLLYENYMKILLQWSPYSLNFSSIFNHFFDFWKRGENRSKSKAIALTFRPFFSTFSIFAKNYKKSKAIAFTCRPFFATFSISEKEAKNDKKVRQL